MLGAMIGDIVGSVYEFDNIKTKDFPFFAKNAFFTDDTAMTIAVNNALIECKGNFENLGYKAINAMQQIYKRYPYLSYGYKFKFWLKSEHPMPYKSLGNGAPMRISAVAYFGDTLEEVKMLSKMVTEVSHNHPEGIKGAECVATCVWLSLQKKTKSEIMEYVETNYYSLDFDYETLKKSYNYDETSTGTVPQAIYCFLISTNFEDLRTKEEK